MNDPGHEREAEGRWHRVWTPPDRSERELRNARVKVVGSLLLLLAVMVGLVLALT